MPYKEMTETQKRVDWVEKTINESLPDEPRYQKARVRMRLLLLDAHYRTRTETARPDL